MSNNFKFLLQSFNLMLDLQPRSLQQKGHSSSHSERHKVSRLLSGQSANDPSRHLSGMSSYADDNPGLCGTTEEQTDKWKSSKTPG